MKNPAKKIIVLLLACILLLTGCSNSANTKNKTKKETQQLSDKVDFFENATSNSDSTPTTPSTNEPTVSTQTPMSTQDAILPTPNEDCNVSDTVEGIITFTYSPGGVNADQKAAADKFVSAFEEKYPDVKVDCDYTQITDERIASGDIGDVFFIYDEQKYDYVQSNALLALDNFVNKLNIDLNDVYSGVYTSGFINGHLYFVVQEYEREVLFYNKDAVDALGVSAFVKPDWTWEEFQALCKFLYNDNYYPIYLNLLSTPTRTAFLEAYTYKNAWYSTIDKKITFIDEEGNTLRAIKEVLELAQKGYANISELSENKDAFNGREYIFRVGNYSQVESWGREYDNRGINWDVINMPLFNNPALGHPSSGLGVYNRTNHPTAASALALFLYVPEGQRAINSFCNSVPTLKSLANEEFSVWKYTDHPTWKDKNWDAFVYKTDTDLIPEQVSCGMPEELAEVIFVDFRKILSSHLNGRQNYLTSFAILEEKCNETWGLLK